MSKATSPCKSIPSSEQGAIVQHHEATCKYYEHAKEEGYLIDKAQRSGISVPHLGVSLFPAVYYIPYSGEPLRHGHSIDIAHY